jgi:hypothetical protein
VRPYFVLVALVHAVAVATRFDRVAAQLPAAAPLAIMLAQFPLLVLSGYFEGGMPRDPAKRDMPRWMQIESRAVKLAFTFALIYLAVIAAQAWSLKLGPLDPSPPASFAPAQRAMWFAMFTLGMGLPFYMLAAATLIPALRFLTRPLQRLPGPTGAVLALALGGVLGLFAMSALLSTAVGELIASVKATIRADPAVLVGVTLATTLGPLVLGHVVRRRRGTAGNAPS